MRRCAAVTLCVLAAVATSCSSESVLAPLLAPAPVADSPASAVRVVEWAWKNRHAEVLPHVFTEDYLFVFALADSAGNAFRDRPWTLVDELAASRNCLGHVTGVQLDFDRTLIPLPDDRAGKNPTWHKYVRTHVDLRVTFDRGMGPEVAEAHGYAKFYAVRGDSASLSAAETPGGRDSTRWWISRWEDETLPTGAARANPAQNRTWGGIKALFR